MFSSILISTQILKNAKNTDTHTHIYIYTSYLQSLFVIIDGYFIKQERVMVALLETFFKEIKRQIRVVNFDVFHCNMHVGQVRSVTAENK